MSDSKISVSNPENLDSSAENRDADILANTGEKLESAATDETLLESWDSASRQNLGKSSPEAMRAKIGADHFEGNIEPLNLEKGILENKNALETHFATAALAIADLLDESDNPEEILIQLKNDPSVFPEVFENGKHAFNGIKKAGEKWEAVAAKWNPFVDLVGRTFLAVKAETKSKKPFSAENPPARYFSPALLSAAPGNTESEKKTWLGEIWGGVSAVGRDLGKFVQENSRTIAIGAAVATGLYFLKSLFSNGEKSDKKESGGFWGFLKKILGIGAIGAVGTMGFKMIEQFLKGDFEGIFSQFAENAKKYGIEKAKEMLATVLGEERAAKFFSWFDKSGKAAELLANPSEFLGKEWETKKAEITKWCTENNVPIDWLPDFPKIYQEYVREKGISTGAIIALGTVLSWWVIKKGPSFFITNIFRPRRIVSIGVIGAFFFLFGDEAGKQWQSALSGIGFTDKDGDGKIDFGEALGGAIESGKELTAKIMEKWGKVEGILQKHKLLGEGELGFSTITPDFLETRLAEFRKSHPTLDALGADELAQVALLIGIVAVSGKLMKKIPWNLLFSKWGITAGISALVVDRANEGTWAWDGPLVAPSLTALKEISKECLPALSDDLELPTGIFDEVKPFGISRFKELREILVGMGIAIPDMQFSREELGQLRAPLTELLGKFQTPESKKCVHHLLEKITELEKKEEGAMLFAGYFGELAVFAREQNLPFSSALTGNSKFSAVIGGVNFPPIFEKNPIPFLRTASEAHTSIEEKAKRNFQDLQDFFGRSAKAPDNLVKMGVTAEQVEVGAEFLKKWAMRDFSVLKLADWEEFSENMKPFGTSEWENGGKVFCFSLAGNLGQFRIGTLPELSEQEIVNLEPYFGEALGGDLWTSAGKGFEDAHNQAAQELRLDFPADKYPKTAKMLLEYESNSDNAFEIKFLIELMTTIASESDDSVWQITQNEGLALFVLGKKYVFGAAGSFSAALVEGLFGGGEMDEIMKHLASGSALLFGPPALIGAGVGMLGFRPIRGAKAGIKLTFRMATAPFNLAAAARTVHVGRNFSEWLAIQGEKIGRLPDNIKSYHRLPRGMRAKSIEKLYILAEREQRLWKDAKISGGAKFDRLAKLKEHLAENYERAARLSDRGVAKGELNRIAEAALAHRPQPRFHAHLRRGAVLAGVLVGGGVALSMLAGDDLEEDVPTNPSNPPKKPDAPALTPPVETEGNAIDQKRQSLETRFAEVMTLLPQVEGEKEGSLQKVMANFSEKKKEYCSAVHGFIDEYREFLDFVQNLYSGKSSDFFAEISEQNPLSLFSAEIKGDAKKYILASLKKDENGVFLESVDPQKLMTYLLESPESDEELLTILFRILPVTGEALDFHDALEHGKKGNYTEMSKSIGWGVFGTALTLSSFFTFGGGAVANVFARLGRVSTRILSLLPKASPAVRALFVRAFEKLPQSVRENESVAKVLSAAKSGVGGNIVQMSATVLVDGICALPKTRTNLLERE